MDDAKHLQQPLLPSTTTTTTTTTTTSRVTTNDDINVEVANCDLTLRFLLVLIIGCISVWASHEASKGFSITVTNDMKNTPLGHKFSLYFISNNEATRLVQGAAKFATEILNPTPDRVPEKIIDQVDIRLANHSLAQNDQIVVTKHHGHKNMYVVSISPSIMEHDDFRYKIKKGIQRCMAQILVSNQPNVVPEALRNGIVDYISSCAGFEGRTPEAMLHNLGDKCWEDRNPKVVAHFVSHVEKEKRGFVGRLSQVMRDGWDEKMLRRGIGMTTNHLCESFR